MSNKQQTVIYEVANGLATITLNRPEQLNAINQQLRRDLRQAVDRAKSDETVRVVVLAGEGRAFCAGADLNDKDGFDPRSVEAVINTEYKPIIMALAEMPKPVISSVNGVAAGIGTALAMVCDLTIMADDAFFLQAFSNIGLIPDGGASWLLSRALGYKNAYQLAVEGERLSAECCQALGLVNKVVPASRLKEETQSWATQLSSRPPLALRYTKQVMQQSQHLSLSDAISYEAQIQPLCIDSEDSKTLVREFVGQ